ncbi:PHP domain-containing protein [Candidatus Kuenenbacteria bacterium]|nr:PHP domain-containing protein [Candidatus Kuenenbacteria bacterium]
MQQKFIDLHMHSVYSDGMFELNQIIKKVKEENISTISLTDHNTISGVEKIMAIGKKNKIKVISGIEFYTFFENKKLHLLGYNFDLKNKELIDLTSQAQEEHYIWGIKTLKKMEAIGFKIDFKELEKFKSRYFGFVHLKNILMKNKKNKNKIIEDLKLKERAKSMKIKKIPEPDLFETINYYFTKDQPGFVPDEHLKISTPLAIKTILKAGGAPILAHPGQQLAYKDDEIILKLKQQGLKGIEAITPYHSWHQIEHYQKLANDLNLIITFGTDFHGDLIDLSLKNQPIKNQWSCFKMLEKNLNLSSFI